MLTIFTIGFTKKTLREFIEALDAASVDAPNANSLLALFRGKSARAPGD